MNQFGRGLKEFFLVLIGGVLGSFIQARTCKPTRRTPICFCRNPECTVPHISLMTPLPDGEPVFDGFEDVPYGEPVATDESGAPLPYMITRKIVTTASYNPKYGGDRKCMCGHPYERHFDGYDDNRAVGCKYCDCHHFVEQR